MMGWIARWGGYARSSVRPPNRLTANRMPRKIGVSNCLACPIRGVSIFAGLTLEDLRRLDIPVVTLAYGPGEAFYHEDARAAAAYTLRSGVVKLTRALPSGRQQIVRLLRTGDIFGFEGLLDSRYHHSAVALDECHVCRLSLPELNALSRANASVREALTQRWAAALRQAEGLVMELGAKRASQRLASFLLHWCRHADGAHWTALPLTRQELGELLGLTVETTSRCLADWKRQGIIEERAGGIRLRDLEALQEHAGPMHT